MTSPSPLHGDESRHVSTSLKYTSPLDYALSRSELGTMPYRLVSEEETAVDYVYKVDRQRSKEEVRVEIRWGRALRVIDQRDAPAAEARLPRNHKARVSRATASVNRNGVITVRVPKRDPPRKWYQDIGFRFRTIRISVSENN